MNRFVGNIEQLTLENSNFRRVIYTASHCQLVVMCLQSREDIGEEVHDVDQFLRIEQGSGQVVLDGMEHAISDGSAVLVPAGVRHNILNTSEDAPMKLYSIYSPPHHRDGVVHVSKDEAM